MALFINKINNYLNIYDGSTLFPITNRMKLDQILADIVFALKTEKYGFMSYDTSHITPHSSPIS